MSKSRSALFCDRDGVVNVDPHPEPYILSWDQWQWMPGIVDFLRTFKAAGFQLVLITSQRGVEKGLMSEADLDGIHRRMQDCLGEQDCAFDRICAYTGSDSCRWAAKPDPGMITESASEMDLDLQSSWLIGDADRDIEMGRLGGVPNRIRFHGLKPIEVVAEHTVDSLAEATELMQTRLRA